MFLLSVPPTAGRHYPRGIAHTFKLLLVLLIVPGIADGDSAVGKKVQVTVEGVNKELENNIRAHLRLEQMAGNSSLDSATVERLMKTADVEIAKALQALGHYSPTIDTTAYDGKIREIRFIIDPGPLTSIRSLDFQLQGEGSDDRHLQQLVATRKLQRGDPLNHQKYSAFKSELQKAAFERGFLDAYFEQHEIRVYPEQQAADITLHFASGPRFYFGDITIEQDILDPAYVQRFVPAEAGDPFESGRLVNLQLALSETNYFNTVNVEIQHDSAKDRHIPVRIHTTPRKARRYEFSAGYGTDTGPRAGAGIDVRRVNRRGHRFLNQLEFSAVQSTLASQYQIPIGDVSSEFLDFTVNLEQEDINEADSTEYNIGTSLNQNRWGGRRRLGLELLHENWSFGDLPSDSATLLVPSLDFTFKNADDPFFARRGFSVTVRAAGAAENVLSDVTFLQAQLFGRAVLPLAERSRLLVRADFAATASDDFDGMPASLRLFAGGAQSVRGYGYKDLSPRDDFGNRTGGKYLATLSAEVDYLVHNNIGLAAFVDAGDATREPLERLKLGAGLGLRYRSPVGMLRFDLAHPFDDPDNSFRVHLSFGIDL